MRKRNFWIVVNLIFLGIIVSCWSWYALSRLPEKKEKPEVVVPAEEHREYKKVPIELFPDGSFHFIVLPEKHFFLEIRFGERDKDSFSFFCDGNIFKIEEAESRGVKVDIDEERINFSWVRLRRNGPEGWTKLLVTPKLYRGKLDINRLKISDDYGKELKDYLKEEEKLEINSPEIKKAAAEIRQSLKLSQRDNPHYLVKATIGWIDDNIAYSLVPKYLVDAFAEVVKKMPLGKRGDPYSLFFEFRKLIPKTFPEKYKDEEINDELLERWTEAYHCLYGKDLPIKNPHKLSFKFLNRLAYFSPFVSTAPWLGEDTTAKNTLKNRLGKCSGISYAFVAICRRLGIPAEKAAGCIVEDSYVEGWHAWAIVYLAGYGWKEVDPTFGEFEDFSYNHHAYHFFSLHEGENVEISAYKLVDTNTTK